MIQVLEQQKLGSKLKTSNGPVEFQQQRKKPKKKKNKKKKNNKAAQNAEALVAELSRQGKTAVVGPSLSFLTSSSNSAGGGSAQPLLSSQSNFDFRTGRQTNLDKVVVPGFPNGLPNGVPEGVKIALAQAQRGMQKVSSSHKGEMHFLLYRIPLILRLNCCRPRW